ncbi:MICAL-like protein 1 isoform X2 [Dicentrarchus labrax]|uniref:MICAL-like protein 1 isoform X2 n=1 Tax=Dicentrarchus labrax TaxID=13489 RepID=UPI0021F66935|nr:MICAL-like protein 1 isoform X2 [Dicentrarchus labrax]
MASLKDLLEWCRVACACYPNVDIKNMSTSFRDGLAFCALIHKHRPDLIDFSSLSKDNVYQNNKLAFEIAETKLGIPALLDPNDMVCTKAPDCLSVITYLAQYYSFFSRKSYAGLASLRSSHVTVLNKSKAPDGLKPWKSSTDLETSGDVRLSNKGPRTVCSLCFKPVHLIQRHWIDGKVYHRSCFRCRVCHSSLLPGSYSRGSEAGSLICTHHKKDSKSTFVSLNQRIGSTENRPKCKFQTGYFSLGGSAITSVPHYTKKTESQGRLVCKTAETEGKERQERSREVKDRQNGDYTVGLRSVVKKPALPHLPPPGDKDSTVEGAGKAGPAPVLADCKIQQGSTQEHSELSSSSAGVTEGISRPVPAPRRTLDSSVVPVPAPRTKTSQTMNSSPAADNSNQNKCPPSSSHVTSPTRSSPKVSTNHPWLAIVHPGPWTQLPPAPAPVPTPRSKSVSNLQRSWYRPKVPAPNPFGEDVDEDTQEEGSKPELSDRTEPSLADVPSGNCVSLSGATNTAGASSEAVSSQIGIADLDESGNTGGSLQDVTAQSHLLPRSLSVPAITSASCQRSFLPDDMTEANECDPDTPCQSKLACKENPFDRKPGIPRSKTFQSLQSQRAQAPGHGFPLIKRKVQTDQNICTEGLQVEMRELEKHLEVLEQRGVELEKNLRDCKNDKEGEQMLMEWLSLIHERHVLVRRDTELVYLAKQQKLEERQADVEYELRCLLNKPESDWSQEDRCQEKQLMEELVAIIEQRNQIISSLDQDRQREREEDMLLEAMMKNKELQKEGLKELKKSKGKFKPTKVFKMLNHKAAESTKDSTDKKN